MDTLGNITIGIGYNLTGRGLPDDWINAQFASDTQYFYDQLNGFAWFANLNTDRQIALVDMCFMGWQKFLEFKNFINYLNEERYPEASLEMLNSEWAKQVGSRAITLASVIRTGTYII